MTTEQIKGADQWFAVELNNRTWQLLERGAERSSEEQEEMIHSAHAALLHWHRFNGASLNRLRAVVLLSYVYGACNDPYWSGYYAEQGLLLLESGTEGIEDWDVPFIYDAAARAAEVAGNEDQAEEYREKAGTLAQSVIGDRDREIVEQTLGMVMG